MRGDSSQLGAGLAEVGLAQNGVGKNLRVSRSTLGRSVFRLYCFLADPKRTVPGSLLMRRISLLPATSTPSKCASPATLPTTVAEVVQSGFTVTVPVNVSDRIVPFKLRVLWPEKFPSPSTMNTPVAAAGPARRFPLRANPHPPWRQASVHVSSSAHAPRAVPNKSNIGKNRRISSFIPSTSTLQPPSTRPRCSPPRGWNTTTVAHERDASQGHSDSQRGYRKVVAEPADGRPVARLAKEVASVAVTNAVNRGDAASARRNASYRVRVCTRRSAPR